jgi:SAM-dependent methyltransferase
MTSPLLGHPRDLQRKVLAGRAWYRYAAQLLAETGGPRGRWVDLGCGQGELLQQLRAGGGRPGAGLDVHEANAAGTLAAGHAAIVADFNRALPFRTASLDGATLVEVIEHIVRAEELVAEIARVVRPGGWLLVTTPNVVHITYRWRAITGHPPKQEGYHYRFFTRELLRRVLDAAGFELRARASFGKQALLSRLARLVGKPRGYKVRYRVGPALEPLLAQHFVWLLERRPA